jgi:hypothetical protein
MLQPRWLLAATVAALMLGIAAALWLYGTLAAG